METNPNPRWNELKEIVKKFPQSPGVYIMRDRGGEVIYVGKAKVLLNRVKSYFSGTKDIKTATLMRRVHSIEYIVTGTEYEALLLENTLIKRHMPRFNISLKDGKSYPLIRLTADDYPRIFKTRRLVQDGSKYYGPFPNVKHAGIYLDLIDKIFPLRKCAGPLKKRTSPCLYYHIGKCLGPCIGKITPEEYQIHVRKAQNLLQGKTKGLIQDLQAEMRQASEELRFERAAELRDVIRAIRELGEGSAVVDHIEESRDYVAMAAEGNLAAFCVFPMREGRLQGREVFSSEFFGTEEEALTEFLLRYYETRSLPAGSVYLSRIIDVADLKQYLMSEGKGDVEFRFPEGGRHLSVLRLAVENAVAELKRRLEGGGNALGLADLKRVLELNRYPRRIEGFDIAHVDGTDPVASLISFHNGLPDRRNYRFFKLRSLKGAIDDFAAMREAVARRYQRLLNEGQPLPDLILIDGGKGQVNAALEMLELLGLDIPICGLAKKNEEIFLPHRSEPIVLPKGSPALRVLQAVRDETHRFATRHNRRIREQKLGKGLLTHLPGVGPKRSQKLLTHYRSLDKIAEASIEEIARVASLPLEVAESIQRYLADRSTRVQTVQELKRNRKL